jgi:hypothetical protein
MLSHLAAALATLNQAQPAQDAGQVLRSAAAQQEQRWSTVNNYTIVQTVNGSPVPLYFEKVSIGGRSTFRSVPISEWSKTDSTVDNKVLMTGMATGTRMLATGFRLEGARAGPAGLGTAIVAGMLDSMALFADFAAVAEDSISDGRAEAAQAVRGMELFAARARLVGEEVVGGRRAYLLQASGLSDIKIEQATDGPVFVLESTSLWLDVAELVPLRLSMAGQMTADRRTIPVTIEQESFDYRAFGPLYEPQRQVMRITGLMEAMTTDPRQRREMERVRRDMERMKSEMARMESELAKLPPSQRRMIAGRMNQAMAQFDQMTGAGVLEMEVQRTVRDWNNGPPLDWRFTPVPSP